MTENVFIIVILVLLVYILLTSRNDAFIQLAYRYYIQSINSGKITDKDTTSDHISTIADHMAKLDATFYQSKYMEPEDIGPQYWDSAREHMAGIILSVTNMAEYYEVDIIDEIIKTVKRDGEKRNKL